MMSTRWEGEMCSTQGNKDAGMEERLNQLIAYSGWIVAVSQRRRFGYRCWVITPELTVLTDGEAYECSEDAIAAGRFLVEHSVEIDHDL